MAHQMFAEDFNPTTTLAAVHCPRCAAVGLVEITEEEHAAAPAKDKLQAAYHIDPSLTCRCLACGLVTEWPACLPG
jgi:hypothetical protein